MTTTESDANHARPDRQAFILLIWPELQSDFPPVWRGMLEDLAGEKCYFDSLAQLQQLIGERGGWVETPAAPD